MLLSVSAVITNSVDSPEDGDNETSLGTNTLVSFSKTAGSEKVQRKDTVFEYWPISGASHSTDNAETAAHMTNVTIKV